MYVNVKYARKSTYLHMYYYTHYNSTSRQCHSSTLRFTIPLFVVLFLFFASYLFLYSRVVCYTWSSLGYVIICRFCHHVIYGLYLLILFFRSERKLSMHKAGFKFRFDFLAICLPTITVGSTMRDKR